MAFNRLCGRLYTVNPFAPVMVSAATIALMIASSVACTVASNNGVISSSDRALILSSVPAPNGATVLRVENATKISPDPEP